MKEDFFRESECFADLACVESAAGQVVALDVSCTFTQQFGQFCHGAVNSAQFCTDEMASLIALLDHLKIKPVFSSFLTCWRSSATAIVRNHSVYFNHGIINTAPTIRNGRRRAIGMPSPFELFKYLNACQGLIFGNPVRYPQACILIQVGGAPKLSAFIRFRVTFFRLCCPRSSRAHPADHV
jgi:hypothetical protein